MLANNSRIDQYSLLREDALANIERLFVLWELDYIKINNSEYDFLNPSRIDKNFGAVRFNVDKGLGADFANVAFNKDDFSSIGKNFDREDFGFAKNKAISYGFDIIGLCQKVNGLASYREAAKTIKTQLGSLKNAIQAPLDAHILREEKRAKDKLERLSYAQKLLRYTVPYVGTVGEIYLKSRAIVLETPDSSIRFHPRIMCAEAKRTFPALVFPIRQSPDSEITGIHRIYLDDTGLHKAPVTNSKMALGEVAGNGIWFGNPGEKLFIAEGPENALSLIVSGAEFVVCTISASNFPNIKIPRCVTKIVLCPDPDEAGMKAATRAKRNYSSAFRKVTIKFPKLIKLPNGKLADLNDVLKIHSELIV